MNTTNKHIGNQLYNMADKDIAEILEQWAYKASLDTSEELWKAELLHYFIRILSCDKFNYNGLIDFENTNAEKEKVFALLKSCKNLIEEQYK